jgi:hypothetical protein
LGAAPSGPRHHRDEYCAVPVRIRAQCAIGAIIDLLPTSPTGGYDPRGYQVGAGVFLVAQVLALDWYLLGGSCAPGRAATAISQLPLATAAGAAASLADVPVRPRAGLSG